ncbi:MAG: hypothetical protein WD934_11700 [Gemmatimonadales bacterium]
MNRLLVGLLLASAWPLGAQAVPDSSQATRVHRAWQRPTSMGLDPFRYVFVPRWGFVISSGGFGENNTLNASDLGAVMVLDDADDFRVGDALDAMSLLPRGAGAQGVGAGEAAFTLAGPIGPLQIGLSAAGRAYGVFRLDDQAVALLRDGNGGTQEFSLGQSGGAALATVEAGAHATYRLKPLGSVDGVRLTLGAGFRMVRPVFYGAARSTVANGGRILISDDSLVANVGLQLDVTPIEDSDIQDAIASGTRGSGVAADFLVRAEWPTNGFALEAMFANLGTVTVERVERSNINVNVASTRLDVVLDSLEVQTADSNRVRDTIAVDVTLPHMVRFSGSAWANRILQLDAIVSLPVTGDFQTPLTVEFGSTWRFIRTIPLRAGLVFGRTQGLGYSAGFGIEGRNMLFRVSGQSLGGFMRNARGAGVQFAFGMFF